MTARPADNPPGIVQDDQALLSALKAGNEEAFDRLVSSWSSLMLRVALSRVDCRASAEEVVQDAWLTVVRTLDRFEQRSSLRTWVLGIVVNLARARARADRRSLGAIDDPRDPSVDASRFLPAEHARWPHHWAAEPRPWPTPEDDLLAAETNRVLLAAIETLPPAQREVLVLRDVEGVEAAEVCNILDVSDTNQRVLLHRARSRVRALLEQYFAEAEGQR
jgi:RNA polymerase sigma-70 factor (ECF subfamily)